MTITVSITEARRDFSGLLQQVEGEGLRVIITLRGKPIAALVPVCEARGTAPAPSPAPSRRD